MSSRFILPFSDVGSGIKPSSGAKLFFFETDGTTPKNTFSDQLSTPTANTNPVIANSNGVFSDIFITGEYKVTLQDKNASQIFGLAFVDELITRSELDKELAMGYVDVGRFGTDAASVLAAFNTLPSEGGTLYFPADIYISPFNSVNPITKNNVTFLGDSMPNFNVGFTALEGGTILQGPVYYRGNGIRFEKLGVDVGSDVCTALFSFLP